MGSLQSLFEGRISQPGGLPNHLFLRLKGSMKDLWDWNIGRLKDEPLQKQGLLFLVKNERKQLWDEEMRALGSTQMASWVESLEGSPKPVQILLQSVIPADQSTCFLKAPHPTFSSYLSIQGSDSTSYRNYPLFRVGLRLRPSIDQCLSNHSQYRSIGLGCHSKETCGTNSTP